MVAARHFLNLSPTFRGLVAMARTAATRVQLCGRLVVKLGDHLGLSGVRFRALDVVILPGYSRPMIRVED